MTPTARSLAHLRKHGWTACVVEQHIRPPGRESFGFKRDALGFGDILACQDLDFFVRDATLVSGILLVQTTSGTNVAHRRVKILAEPKARTWLHAGGRIAVHGWAKRGPRGKRKLWTLHEEEVTLQDFAAHESQTSGTLAVP